MKPTLFRLPGSLFCTEALIAIVGNLLEQSDFKIRIDYCEVLDAEGVDTVEEMEEIIDQVTVLSQFIATVSEFKVQFDWLDLRVIEYLDGPVGEKNVPNPSVYAGRYEVVRIELVDMTDLEISCLVAEPSEFVKELFESLCNLAQALAEQASSENTDGTPAGQYGPAQEIIY